MIPQPEKSTMNKIDSRPFKQIDKYVDSGPHSGLEGIGMG
jgi:hypothetical protein